MSVINLAEVKAERQPHWSGAVRCMGCGHEWVGVGPVGTIDSLECPSCTLPKGVVKHLWGAPEGALSFQCNCGCDVLTAYIYHRKKIIRCVGCGADQTMAVWE